MFIADKLNVPTSLSDLIDSRIDIAGFLCPIIEMLQISRNARGSLEQPGIYDVRGTLYDITGTLYDKAGTHVEAHFGRELRPRGGVVDARAPHVYQAAGFLSSLPKDRVAELIKSGVVASPRPAALKATVQASEQPGHDGAAEHSGPHEHDQLHMSPPIHDLTHLA